FTTEDTDVNSDGTLPVGSDARTLAFNSPADMFGLEDRVDDSPFVVLDDSVGSNVGDTAGILTTSDTGNFFGVADNVNGESTGPLSAEWTFDISSATGGLELSIDMAAMGNFEDGTDVFLFEVSIDSSAFTSAFTGTVDESATQTYTLESGTVVPNVDDPLSMNGVLLNNNFQTLAAQIAGTGNSLTLRFTSESNGSDEAFAFRNIIIEGLTGDPVLAGDFNDDDVVDVKDYTVWRDNLGAGDELALNGNGDGMNGVDAGDYVIWFNAFSDTNASFAASPNAVPEPGGMAMAFIMLSCFLVVYHRSKLHE
ncbi:MAG: hypothetical protein ACR2NU_05570, partial [Aeoliella sp.]